MSQRVQPSIMVRRFSRRCPCCSLASTPNGEMGEGKSYSPAFSVAPLPVLFKYNFNGHSCLITPSDTSLLTIPLGDVPLGISMYCPVFVCVIGLWRSR